MNQNDLSAQNQGGPDLCPDCGMETNDFRKQDGLAVKLLLRLSDYASAALEDMHVGMEHKEGPENAVLRRSSAEKLKL